MLKGLFFCVPSVSVDRTLTPVIDAFCGRDLEIVYYNTVDFRSPGDHPFRFIAYPNDFDGYYSDRIDENTSYFEFSEILIETASQLMDFLLSEVEREKPDFILHSHLAVWGKLISRHFRLPGITLYTTFVLDQRIMLPFFRKMIPAKNAGLQNVHAAVDFYRKSHALYSRLQLPGKPDPWDAYINSGDLNLSFILPAFQPQRQLFDKSYAFLGYPVTPEEHPGPKDHIYVAMGTILNKDVGFYRLCIDVLGSSGCPCILSLGSAEHCTQFDQVPPNIRVVSFADQRAILKKTRLFITRGGMASIHEAIHTLTPMIVIPVIPEQQITAQRIGELGIGLVLPAANVSKESLAAAVKEVLSNSQRFVRNIESLLADMPSLAPQASAGRILRSFLREHSNASETLVDLFIRQAETHPHVIAGRDRTGELNFGQLYEKAVHLSHILENAGVGPDVPVGVLMEPCIDILVAIVGILMAGGCYIPIDPEFPPGRIGYILNDSACPVLLCNKTSLGLCPQTGDRIRFCVDALADPIGESSIPDRCHTAAPEDLAYIIYTSGSTGKPKGVMVEHAQIYRYILEVRRRLDLDECNSLAILGTFSADAGLTAVFEALCFGKTLNILNIKAFSHFGDLVAFFRQHPVDAYKTTPSLLFQLLQNEAGPAILPLKRLILGGESCPETLANRVAGILPDKCRLFNHYGPTETTVGVTTYAMGRQTLPSLIPVGQPLPSVQAHILDRNGAPTPAGEIGELYIGGALVARGYLNNPELTNDRFPTLTVNDRATRLYNTGDMVRQLPDGNIEFHGRRDHQLKIRGNRIEPGEIEAAILASGLVRQCLVQAKPNRRGAICLTAYFQPKGTAAKEDILRFVRASLPAFMIPGTWVPLEEWPLTVNNKTDRLALPDPESEVAVTTASTHSSGDGITDTLTTIWAALLEKKTIGAGDDFFDLGGDSLLLMQLSFEIHNRLAIEFPANELFEYSTIGRLAARLSQLAASKAADGEATSGNGEASLAQRNLFIQSKLYPHDAFPNSSLTFEIHGDPDLMRLEKAFSRVIQENESLRAYYHFVKGILYQRTADVVPFRLEHRPFETGEIDKAIANAVMPFDLTAPPLIRAILFACADGQRYLHLYLPHINSDGESMKMIMKDIEAIYNGSPRMEKRPPFSEFLRQGRAYRHSEQFAEDEEFWKKQLFSDMPPLKFNFSGARSSGSYGKLDGCFAVVPFPDELGTAMEHDLPGKKITTFQLLFISFAILLYKITGSVDFAILLPVHGRNKAGHEHIIGLLSNVVAVRLHPAPDLTLIDFVGRSRKTILEAIRHQQYPFELTQGLWKQQGRKLQTLAQCFFGYHRHKGEYRLGDAALNLYIPEKDKENLPISAAVFDTETGKTLRLSSTAGGFDHSELRELAKDYFAIVHGLIHNSETDTLKKCIQLWQQFPGLQRKKIGS